MPLARPVTRHEHDVLRKEFRELKRQIGRLQNQHSPTVPIYDPDFPDDAVNGQFALASEPPEDAGLPTMKAYYRDPVGWHPLTGLDGKGIFKYIALDGRADVAPPLAFVQPVWDIRSTGPDPEIFDTVLFGATSGGVVILQAGLYLIRSEMRCASDWPLARILCTPNIDGGGGADFIAGFGENDSRLNYYFGEGSSLAFPVGINLVHEGLLQVRDPGAGIAFRLEITTDPGDITHTNVLFEQFAMRLSSNPNANQS